MISLCFLFSCNNNGKKTEGGNSADLNKFAQNQIIKGFDLHDRLGINIMMDIPFSVYVKIDAGQFSVMYLPKEKEALVKYKDFDKKNGIVLPKDSVGNEYYDENAKVKIDKVLRSDLKPDDFYIIGRYIPYKYLIEDIMQEEGNFNVSIPYEMQVYLFKDNKWQLLRQVVITDLLNYEHYESLDTYYNMVEDK